MSRHVPAHRARRARAGWRPAAFAIALVLLVGSGVSLAYAGVRTVRESTAGQRIDPTTDPADPGFEGFVEPTPTLLVVHEGADGLVGAAVLSLRGEGAGGGVLLLPGGTLVDPLGAAQRLDDIHAFSGAEATEEAVAQVLGIGIGGVKVVDGARWIELVEPVAPIRLHNPDELEDFPAGQTVLAPADVTRWLEAEGPGASGSNRLVRQQLFWEAWIDAVRAEGTEDAVPGELDAGLGSFVLGVATGPSRVTLLPAREEPGDERGTVFVPDPTALNRLVAELVPFPTAAEPGGRARIRLLDGTGDPDLALRVAPRLVPAGAEIVIVGNAADGFDHRTSEVRHHAARLAPAAERLQEALGFGRVVADPRPTDTYDLTIVLGADAARAIR